MVSDGLRDGATAWSRTVTDAAGVRAARMQFASYLRRRHLPEDLVQDCLLIFGELAGNAVVHAGGDVRIRVSVHKHQPVLCITDRAGDAKVTIGHTEAAHESGRGLRIVQRLSRGVWIERAAGMKSVCAALPCREATASFHRNEISA